MRLHCRPLLASGRYRRAVAARRRQSCFAKAGCCVPLRVSRGGPSEADRSVSGAAGSGGRRSAVAARSPAERRTSATRTAHRQSLSSVPRTEDPACCPYAMSNDFCIARGGACTGRGERIWPCPPRSPRAATFATSAPLSATSPCPAPRSTPARQPPA